MAEPCLFTECLRYKHFGTNYNETMSCLGCIHFRRSDNLLNPKNTRATLPTETKESDTVNVSSGLKRIREQNQGLPSEIHEPYNRLKRIAEIIEGVDQRCMGADGPVARTLEVMTQDDISEIYKLANWMPSPKPPTETKGKNKKSQRALEIKRLRKKFESLLSCNCVLDNWVPEHDTGHSWVCRIHRAIIKELEN